MSGTVVGAPIAGQVPPPTEFADLALAMLLDNPDPSCADDARGAQLRVGDCVQTLRSDNMLPEGTVGTIAGTAADGHDDRSQRVLVDFGSERGCRYVSTEDLQVLRPEHDVHPQRDGSTSIGICHCRAARAWRDCPAAPRAPAPQLRDGVRCKIAWPPVLCLSTDVMPPASWKQRPGFACREGGRMTVAHLSFRRIRHGLVSLRRGGACSRCKRAAARAPRAVAQRGRAPRAEREPAFRALFLTRAGG